MKTFVSVAYLAHVRFLVKFIKNKHTLIYYINTRLPYFHLRFVKFKKSADNSKVSKFGTRNQLDQTECSMSGFYFKTNRIFIELLNLSIKPD